MSTHDPDFDPPVPTHKDVDGLESVAATSCLGWGIIAMLTWWLPLFGQVFQVAGLVRGYQGWRAPNRDRARLGVVLSLLSLMLTIILVAWFVQALRDMPDF